MKTYKKLFEVLKMYGVVHHESYYLSTGKFIEEFPREPFRTDFYVVCICKSGEILLEADGVEYVIAQNHFFVSAPSTVISFSHTKKNFEMRLLLFEKNFVTKHSANPYLIESLGIFKNSAFGVYETNGEEKTIPMTEDTYYGTNEKAPIIQIDNSRSGQSSGWTLWKNLADRSEIFGKPEKFCGDISKSAWESATLTCKPSALTEKLKEYSVNDPYSGKTVTGGIVTITDSNWLMSVTCNRQPHFPTQPDDVLVLWVYSLFMDKKGNYVQKTMPESTGNEILAELCYHFGIEDQLENVIENTIVRTSFMPYITSMFMPRAKGDRPSVVPEGFKNLGLLGQFVETNNDVVFTMDSSIRTARIAVYTLLNLNKQVPDIYPLQYDIHHLLKAAKTLNDGKSFPGEKALRAVLKGTYYEHILPENKQKDENEDHHSFLGEKLEQLKHFLESF